MFNNRMLAVAAVLVMAVPALGAATPIVVPPVPEQLVEGHTVFTVIEIVKATQTNEVRFAAAVAVLVREYQKTANAQRFPGVLWFNDQYLVNPVQDANDNRNFRYPCGGAVLAVNRGDPDPRVVIAHVGVASGQVQADLPDGVDDNTGDVDEGFAFGNVSVGDSEYTYDSTWSEPTPGTYYYGQPGGPSDYAWIGADSGAGAINATNPSIGSSPRVWSDTVVGSLAGGADAALLNATPPWDYDESYLITDPNDHSWVIDKYKFYTRDQFSSAGGLESQNADNEISKLFDDIPATADGYQPSEQYPIANGGTLETSYAFPVWVVNILGTPVFVPDNGIAIAGVGENCVPFKDLIEDTTAPLNGALCGVAIPDAEFVDAGNDTDITLNAYNGVPPWTDDPCMSYQEPSRNGYCYGGQEDTGVGCPHGPTGNGCDIHPTSAAYSDQDCTVDNDPLRQYNALLYFKLEDLTVPDAPRDHSDPTDPTDTNGCSEEFGHGTQAARDWPCPDADDNREGNSHPFHPTAPPHEEAEPCLTPFAGPNPTNHGGSTYIAPGTRATDDGWFEVTAPCDYLHATRNIDIYFNGGGRPFPPVLRYFDVVDLEGSSAPFQDFHTAYGP